MSYTPTYTTNNGVGCQSTSGDQKVGLSDGGILLQYNLNSTPHKFFDITPSGVSWTNGTTTLTTSLDRLAAVETAFTSIELPPNTTTLKVNDTIQLSNGTQTSTIDNNSISFASTDPTPIDIVIQANTTPSIPAQIVITDNTTQSLGMILDPALASGYYVADLTTGNVGLMEGNQLTIKDNTNPASVVQSSVLNNSSLTINNVGTSNSTQLTTTSLSFTGSNTTDINLNGTDFRIDGNGNRVLITTPSNEFYAGDPFGSSNGTTLAILDSSRWILLNSVDVTTNCGAGGNNYTIPVNFTTKWAGGYGYSSAGSWDMVRTTTISLPNEYFTLSNQPQLWKIEVAFNCYNMTDQTNKEYAMYLQLRDDNGATYQGFSFNQNTPFTTHRNASTYSATSSNIENYCWTDHFDLSGFANGNIEIQIWRYANANMTTDFNAIITFSKTNLV